MKTWLIKPLPWFCSNCTEQEVRNLKVTQQGIIICTCEKCGSEYFSDMPVFFEVELEGKVGVIKEVDNA